MKSWMSYNLVILKIWKGMEQSIFYRGNKTKPRKALSDIDNLLKKISSKTPE